jgi:HSP20 family protein
MAHPRLLQWRRGSELSARRGYGFHPIVDLHSELNRLFDDFWRSFGEFPVPAPGAGPADVPSRVDVEETDAAIRVTAQLPGFAKQDLELRLERDTLVIRGEQREERSVERSGLSQHERLRRSFERRIRLACAIDAEQVAARFEAGVLSVTLPKLAGARRAVTIPIEAG